MSTEPAFDIISQRGKSQLAVLDEISVMFPPTIALIGLVKTIVIYVLNTVQKPH